MNTAQNTSGFSIALAMGLVVILSLTGLYVIEYMVPFARNIKGIENASQAFYESYAGVEEVVLSVYDGVIGTDYTKAYSSDQDYSYNFDSRGTIIPGVGLGNSPYDPNSNFSLISQREAISLAVGNNLFGGGTNALTVNFRVPNIDGIGGLDSLESGGYDDIILWQLSSETASLSSKDIMDISAISKGITVNLFASAIRGLELGDPVTATGTRFSDFYTTNCGLGNLCVLKFSIVKPLVSPTGGIYSHLEYRLTSSDAIPYPNTQIRSNGKSYGFTKILDVYIPQQTTSSAFDFTVLQ